MSQVTVPPAIAGPAERRGIKLTRRHYHALADAGLLDGRYELIDGEIVPKMPHTFSSVAHIYVVRRFMTWLAGVFGAEYLQCQSPIDVAGEENETNEPEPDVAVTAQPETAYASRLPGPSDLLLVVEVSDTTLRYDLTVKAGLYARAGIAEFWVADLAGRRFHVHRHPAPAGYAEVTVYTAEQVVAPLARPEVAVRVADLLPPAGMAP